MPTGEDSPDSAADQQRVARFRVLDLSAVGLAFPVALLLGYFGGRLIGGWLGNPQLGGLIGALVGIVGGFYNLFKMVSRLAPRGAAAGGAMGTTAAGAAGAAGPSRDGRERRLGDPKNEAGLDDDADLDETDLEEEALDWLDDDNPKADET